MEQALIIGAGPCGLSAAVELKKRGIDPLIIEKGCIVNSIFHYPTQMQFFTTPELLEIGEIPFMTAHEKPSRAEALNYYREVANRGELRIRNYEQVERVERGDGYFKVSSVDRFQTKHEYQARFVIVATGYFDNPNRLGVPGEELPKVTNYFKEAHPYQGMKVAIIGGKNSAVEAAMQLVRVGAEVTLIYRREAFTSSVKPWIRPLIDSMIEKGLVQVHWNSHVTEIKERSIVVDIGGRQEKIDNDAVLAMIGFHPDRKLLFSMGIELSEETGAPVHNPATMETNAPGIYIAGVIAAGNNANEIFIENGRFHGGVIAEHIKNRIS
ncbi:hypothetical protein BEP19_08150 [Ammoniphilus oxalaticus]|uniref:Uncharacterized protein n=1 Tax=Ammoniphilus oxalaticus TaxID=66863 RepID=A0A419SK92_9BACL|nr:YpdA family putative bacillithiol disulfide reductase [Ammoniphilus oxalaticus]RKD24356.1 hypothetical protein BEP19_08150 [Ammoniphilus oxalaticus]